MDVAVQDFADRLSPLERRLPPVAALSRENAESIQGQNHRLESQLSQIHTLQSDLSSLQTSFESTSQRLATDCARGLAEMKASWQECSAGLSTTEVLVQDLITGQERLQQDFQRLIHLLQQWPPPDPRSSISGASSERPSRRLPSLPRIEITVQPFRKQKITFVVSPTNRIADVKRMVGEMVGISVDGQRLFTTQALADESTCEDYGIEDGYLLWLAQVPPHGKYIAAQFLDQGPRGWPVIVESELSDRVEDLKRKIQDGEGIPPEQQRFVYRGRLMEDEKTLADYGVPFGAVIHLIVRLRG